MMTLKSILVKVHNVFLKHNAESITTARSVRAVISIATQQSMFRMLTRMLLFKLTESSKAGGELTKQNGLRYAKVLANARFVKQSKR